MATTIWVSLFAFGRLCNMTGHYHRRSTCRGCHSRRLIPVLHLGELALAGAFLKADQLADEHTYPLELCLCPDCFLLQVVNIVAKEILFSDYFYFSSAIKTLRDHFSGYAGSVSGRFLTPGKSFVVEIGCNDGVLLRPLRDLGIRVLGVDPASNIVRPLKDEGIPVINDYFTERVAESILEQHGAADVIAANNVFAHIDDLHDVVRGIHKLLGPNGVFVFEVHYIKSVIGEAQYDMIYHEHLSYYSLLALQTFFRQFGMEVFDVEAIRIHAGSKRYYVRKKGNLTKEKVSERVSALLKEELAGRYDKVETYLDVADRVALRRKGLRDLLEERKRAGRSVVGYGASGRANTIIQYCGLDNEILDYVIDDAPAKHGFYTPGSHLLIRPRTALDQYRPDYVLVFAWAFLDEIKERCRDYLGRGGKLIIPLPEVKILYGSELRSGADLEA